MPKAHSHAQYDALVKIVLIGDSGVGKSGLLSRFADDMFNQIFLATIGIDFKVKTLDMDGKRIKFQIWDTAGQERFRNISNAYYRRAMGILLVYNTTDESSFQNVRSWMRNIEMHAANNVQTVIIGTKCDLIHERVVASERGQLLADEYGIPFLETSAKEATNVERAFTVLAHAIMRTRTRTDSPKTPSPITLDVQPRTDTTTHGTCCK